MSPPQPSQEGCNDPPANAAEFKDAVRNLFDYLGCQKSVVKQRWSRESVVIAYSLFTTWLPILSQQGVKTRMSSWGPENRELWLYFYVCLECADRWVDDFAYESGDYARIIGRKSLENLEFEMCQATNWKFHLSVEEHHMWRARLMEKFGNTENFM